MIYCTFYTPEYEHYLPELLESASLFGITVQAECVPTRSRWVANTNIKAEVVRVCLEDGEPVVWIDVDARFRQSPSLFDRLDCDFAAHWRDGRLKSGTLFFAASDNAKALCDLWIHESRRNPGVWDQINLEHVLERVPGLVHSELPRSYCAKFDDKGVSPVIEHMQASRTMRRRIQ